MTTDPKDSSKSSATNKESSAAAADVIPIPANAGNYPKYDVEFEGPGIPSGVGTESGLISFIGPHTKGEVKISAGQRSFVVELTHKDTETGAGPKLLFKFIETA